MTHSDDDDDDDGKWVWPHPADLGTILIAGVFLVGMIGALLFIFSSPEPVRDMFNKKPPAAESNEVTVTLPDKK
jgi:hypothetical protein